MELRYRKCAGLDVHAASVVACVRVVDEHGHVQHDVRTFGTMTGDLLALAAWLEAQGCTHVVLESTGVYWKPVWHVLEGSVELILANAMHVRNIPGRKSDVQDAVWLADLLAHDLIRSSVVPPAPVQALRDLTRTRKQLVRDIVQHTQRIQKVLEDANLKLTGIISDLLGMSGRALLRALIAGETDPARLVAHTTGRLRAPAAVLREALRGRVPDHHRFLLQLHLGQIAALEQAVREVEARIGDTLGPFRAAVERLTTMPGISETMARVVVAEIGTDMTRFPTAGHLVSWAGLCPRLHESAGKRRSTRTRPGAPWLKTNLVQAAWGAVRTRNSYFRAQFVRVKSRRGSKKAIVAVAASMLTAAYYMLRDDVPYRDLGADHFDRRDKAKLTRRLVRRLQDLGLHVEVRPAA
jgi:transposase